VLNESKQLPKVIPNVQHHIETEGRPVAAKYRRLDPAKLAAAKKEFIEMCVLGLNGPDPSKLRFATRKNAFSTIY
jgi:hypothetical protein